MGNNNHTFMEIFQRGSANIRWCEDVLTVGSISNESKDTAFIAEFYNTISNSIFVLVALLGLKRVVSQKESTNNFGACVLAESIMAIGVGLGSMLFHAHQSRFSEFADEVPMCLLLIAYNLRMKGLHPVTSNPKYSGSFYAISHSVVAGLWALYFYTHIYGIFETCFTLQVLVSLALSYDAGRRANVPSTYWWISVLCIGVAKAIWEVERHRFKNDACEEPGTLLLHPLWHLGSALSHYMSMLNIAQIEKKVQLEASRQDKKTQ